MNAFEWGSLRVGDHVLVHDLESGSPTVARRIAVAFVTRDQRRHGRARVGLRAPGDSGVALWPTPAQVHLETDADRHACVSCSTG